jgi:hypothetical protein
MVRQPVTEALSQIFDRAFLLPERRRDLRAVKQIFMLEIRVLE